MKRNESTCFGLPYLPLAGQGLHHPAQYNTFTSDCLFSYVKWCRVNLQMLEIMRQEGVVIKVSDSESN